MLGNYTIILDQADIYSAIAVVRYPYNICSDVLRAFLELWSPLNNTSHFAGGEIGISLLDMKMICGLPITSMPYEEFIPSNHQLQAIDEEGKASFTRNCVFYLLLFGLAAKKISSQEKFVKDVNREDVENPSVKLSNHLKNLGDLNSQLQDSREQLQELENRKIVLLKEEVIIQAEKLQVENKCGILASGIATFKKSLEHRKK
ncbi:hypothetical protein ACH5RR_028846 [Cinchona calisaya]|uniref:Aminotransferase-like plant mobile domain-containing protein n=1 Tax=Cinchona calisaya TaxID=153742 RepID=A0ABD2YTK0_9GENT